MYLTYGIDYIPQIPILLFICIILGRKYAFISIACYIIIGLFLPIFSAGGGIKYVLQYNFGYILAFLPAVWVATSFLDKNRKFLNCLLAIGSAVLIIHVLGGVYLTLIAIAKHDTFDFAWGLISHQSFGSIIYDFVLGYVAIMFARPAKHLLWIAMG